MLLTCTKIPLFIFRTKNFGIKDVYFRIFLANRLSNRCLNKVIALLISLALTFLYFFFLKLTADVLPLQAINLFIPKNNSKI